ncbi:hypothetical protein, conserved [Trypanosoma brucei brucei TREU927]|uniref:Palmitoyltransferase n=1 Tax=Trypanosoma brucei brucei (strain 927/4 GUTat10.1) TaxID=185431 RepID=Q385E7_TRYB2|nr:hypothetical protein, conserved [Trypanosoma brucei brucei TREU927]EAN79584.1 hypothetical protein, conserved [Trypanosoma brucei brucei TREU927]
MPTREGHRRNRRHRRSQSSTSDVSGAADTVGPPLTSSGHRGDVSRNNRNSAGAAMGQCIEESSYDEGCSPTCGARNPETTQEGACASRTAEDEANAWAKITARMRDAGENEGPTKLSALDSPLARGTEKANSAAEEAALSPLNHRISSHKARGGRKGGLSPSSHHSRATELGSDRDTGRTFPSSMASVVPAPLPPIEGPLQLAWPPNDRMKGSTVSSFCEQHSVVRPPGGSDRRNHGEVTFMNNQLNAQHGAFSSQKINTSDRGYSETTTNSSDGSSESHAGCSVDGIAVPQWSNPNQTPSDGALRASRDVNSLCSDSPADRVRNHPPCASCCVDRSNPDSWRYNKPRRHAFQWPLHSLQIMAICTIVTFTALFVSSVVPGYVLLYRDEGCSECLWEVIVSSTLVLTSIVCTSGLMLVIAFRENGDINDEGEPCSFCERRTLLDSRHCKACNKCIEGFDHHCKWLNMCIGSKNYRLFIAFVTSALCSMVLGLIAAVVFLAKWWNRLLPYSVYFRAGPLLFCALVLLTCVPLIHLLGFHIMLNRANMTTYEYIMSKRQVSQPRQGNVLPAAAAKELERL